MSAPYQTIDTRWGTRNSHRLGQGNTLPYTGVPFGMNHFVLETRLGESRFFHPEDGTAFGIRLTHQPSPWMGDFAWVTWQVACLTDKEWGQLKEPLSAEASRELASSGYRGDLAQFRPGFLSYQRLRDGLQVACCPTQDGASLKVTPDRRYPKGHWVMSLVLDQSGWYELEGHQLTYYTNQLAGSKYGQYGQFGRMLAPEGVTFKFCQVVNLGEGLQQLWLDLDGIETIPSQSLHLEWVTSYISPDQLMLNYGQSDFFGQTWDQQCAQTEAAWEDYLSRLTVSHRERKLVDRFYHCLYRTATFPQAAYEWSEAGEPIHQSPYTGKLEHGFFFTNNGYWDTFRTNYPLYALIVPEMVPLFLEGILTVAQEDGFLPKWLSPDERGLMPGTLVDAVIADAVVKGLVAGDLAQKLYEAMLYTAETESVHSLEGRQGGADYSRLGYLPASYSESVNKSLDYAYSDFCISQVAQALGDYERAKDYRQQSLNYRHLFDDETGLMRAKDQAGQFLGDFVSQAWGGPYTEGSAWQQSFAVYHNLADLVALHGGDAAFYEQLQSLVNQPASYRVDGYGYEIHEMLEMARRDWGQLALSNQPSFHLPYLPIYAGYPHMAHQLLKSLMLEAFKLEEEGYIGDEDNGSLSAWFVLSSLGIYAVTPGANQYVLGISIWDQASLNLSGGLRFQWSTLNPSQVLNVVLRRQLNGRDYDAHFLTYEDIMAGGQLEQELGFLPSLKPTEPSLRPFSLALNGQREYNSFDCKIEEETHGN